MTTPPQDSENMDMRALIRKLEDIRDANNQLKVQIAFTQNELEAVKEMEKNELKRNAQLERHLKIITEQNKKETEIMECVQAIRLEQMEGSIERLADLSKEHLEEMKRVKNLKKTEIDRRVADHIQQFVTSRPLVRECNSKVAHYGQLVRQMEETSKKAKEFREKAKEEERFTDLLFQESVVELAQHALRHYSIADKLKNPTRKTTQVTRRNAVPIKAKPLDTLQEPSESGAEPDSSDVQMMPETPSTSKCQETIDTNEVGDDNDQSLVRGSGAHTGNRMKKVEVNPPIQLIESTKPEENKSQRIGSKKLKENAHQRTGTKAKAEECRDQRDGIKKKQENQRRHNSTSEDNNGRHKVYATEEEPPKKTNVSAKAKNQNKKMEAPVAKQLDQAMSSANSRKVPTEATMSSLSQKTKNPTVVKKTTVMGPKSSTSKENEICFTGEVADANGTNLRTPKSANKNQKNDVDEIDSYDDEIDSGDEMNYDGEEIGDGDEMNNGGDVNNDGDMSNDSDMNIDGNMSNDGDMNNDGPINDGDDMVDGFHMDNFVMDHDFEGDLPPWTPHNGVDDEINTSPGPPFDMGSPLNSFDLDDSTFPQDGNSDYSEQANDVFSAMNLNFSDDEEMEGLFQTRNES